MHDKFAVIDKWESSGRNMGKLTEKLADECVKPPVVAHVSVQGREALFSGNMTLKEVIMLLKEQQSTTTLTQENARPPLPISQGMFLATAHKDSEDGQNNPWNASEEDCGVGSPGNEIDSLFITQKDPFPQSDGPCYLSVHKKIQERSFFCTECQKGFYTHTGQPETLHKRKKPFKCCTRGRSFSHKTTLLASKRIHTGQKSYTCKCNLSYQPSSTYPLSPEALAQVSFKWQSCLQ